MSNVGYSIRPHENGWAVMQGGLIKGVYPSELLAEKSIAEGSDQDTPEKTAKDRAGPKTGRSARTRPSDQPVVSVPDNVSLPLKDEVQEVRVPADISGRYLSTGKL
jgi:hypothetical protein